MKETILDRLLRLAGDNSPRAHSAALGILVVVAAELAALIVVTGCPNIKAKVWDVCIALDGAWRVVQGQRPHTDFYSQLGVVPLSLLALGLKLSKGTADACAWTHAILLPSLAVWTWAILRKRTSGLFGAAMGLYVGALAVAPRGLGQAPEAITFAMQYNRWGWALLVIALIEALIPRNDKRSSVLEAASTGLLAGLLLFTKMNYFGGAALAILVRLFAHGLDWRWLRGVAAGFLTVTALAWWRLGFDFRPFVADLRLLSAVNPLSWHLASLAIAIVRGLPELALIAGLLIVGFSGRKRPPGSLMIPLAMACLGLLVTIANYDMTEIPLFAVAAFAVAEILRREVAAQDEPARIRFAFAALVACSMIGTTLFHDLTAIAGAFGQREGAIQVAEGWRLDSPALGGMVVDAPAPASTEVVRAGLRSGAVTLGENAGQAYPFVVWFNDGARLLRESAGARARVVALDYCNPFSFGLGLTPPRGDSIVWHFHRNFDRTHHPPPQRVFGDATHVLIPKAPINPVCAANLRAIYFEYVARNFHPAAENDLWALYAR